MTYDCEKLTRRLTAEGFTVSRFEREEDAAAWLCGELAGQSVGIGGSMTVEQLGLYDRLCAAGCTVHWHWRQPGGETLRRAAEAQVYISSANAIAESGEIINIDGSGNRVAALGYGHERIVIVAGTNKIAPDYATALARARNIAAPLNARRLSRKTPCALCEPDAMRCYDCASPDRICRELSVLLQRPSSIPHADVVLIDRPLGY